MVFMPLAAGWASRDGSEHATNNIRIDFIRL